MSIATTPTNARARPVQFPLQTGDVPHVVDYAIHRAREAGAGMTMRERVMIFVWGVGASGDLPPDAEIGRAVGCTEDEARVHVASLIADGLFPESDDPPDPDDGPSSLDWAAYRAISARKLEMAGRGPWADSRRAMSRGARVVRGERREGG